MIKNRILIEEFEKELLRKQKTDYKRNFSILNQMYKQAVIVKIFPMKNPIEGLEKDLKIAKVVNSVSKTTTKNCKRIE
ncbi:MAG: hypothetical protein NC816_01520 [Candidatus Omnitrophica bacterium]|nr:hypothetical protein [Candidatus Omnitrophota bacterium]MCM8809055.1 hypothetical protein [Candidatus Omnitrophota bacterium]MCM8810737.1 hypothetical protein [Candidatus Omnitrophota bacterium]MCM8832592.1 hypothetical protein [Candidatus Omnitrophota bacterium]